MPDSVSLFDRQIRAAARTMPWAHSALGVAFVFVGALVLPPTVGAVARWIWTGVGVVVCLGAVLRWSRVGMKPIQIYREALAIGQLLGIQMTIALFWCFRDGTSQDQLLITATVAGVIGCGAIALSPSRSLAVCWVVGLSVGPAVVLLVDGSPHLQLLTLLLLLYVATLVLGVLHLSDSFRARWLAEQAAAAGRLDVQLLLSDFEAGARDWLWEVGSDGLFSRASERFSQLSGLSTEELCRLSLPALLRQSGAEQTAAGRAGLAEIEEQLGQERQFDAVVVPVRIGQEQRWWSLSGKPQPDGTWRGLGADLTEATRAQERIDRLATTDPITGLPNRHAFNRELSVRLARAGSEQPLFLGIVDIDNFKSVNDTLGHPVGDVLIAEIAVAIARELREEEFCSRFGGDEFAVILADGTTTEEAEARFLALHRAIKSWDYPVDGIVLPVTSSIGIASSELNHDGSSLISAADLALYAAKGQGRDQMCSWHPGLTEAANRRSTLIQELTSGVSRREFEAHWQPQVDLSSGEVVGMEALIRWRHPQLGLLEPGQFLQVAIESGLIVDIGDVVLRSAVEVAVDWPELPRVSVNVSARELAAPGFADRLLQRVVGTGLAPGRLVVEVTEDVAVNDEALAALTALRDAGLGISMDDFGTGYSSFAQLARMPLDEIKIDRSLVGPMVSEERLRVLVRTIVDMARALGARVVAEGVETAEQRDLLQQMGCHLGQGVLVGRPVALPVRTTVSRRLPVR